MEATFELAALAYSVEVIKPKPILITDPAAIHNLRFGDEDSDDTEPVEISLEGAAIFMPQPNLSDDDFSFQAPVGEVEVFNVFDIRFTRMAVTLSRMSDDDGKDRDFNIDLYAAEGVWHSSARPMPGTDVSGLLWLQGRLADAKD